MRRNYTYLGKMVCITDIEKSEGVLNYKPVFVLPENTSFAAFSETGTHPQNHLVPVFYSQS